MTFQCIFKHFVYFFVISTPGLCFPDTTCSKINVVVFFADSSKIPSSAAGMKFLEMQEMARVKQSSSTTRDTRPYSYIAQRNVQNCKELLHEGLESLTHFCQNALGMRTAPNCIHIEMKVIRIKANANYKDDFVYGGVYYRSAKARFSFVGDDRGNFDDIEIPTVTVSSKSITNDMHNEEPENPRYSDKLTQRGAQKFRRSKDWDDMASPVTKFKKTPLKDVITSPEHTEVFNIRVKRDEFDDGAESKVGEIADVPFGREKTKPPWDVLDVMSHVRFSFFGNLFEDEKKKKLSKEENEMLSNVIGQKKQDPGLFESVKSTLGTLQEAPSEPFLMIVFGGHFSEICDKQSPLVQSLKHVIESTDPKKTLIILTGACPEGKCDNRKEHDSTVVIKESYNPDLAKDERNSVLPLYAKGPKSDQLTRCTILYDIPLTLKDILEEMSPTFGGRS